jgi:diguanylate cyclase (GGDEF)-like protein
MNIFGYTDLLSLNNSWRFADKLYMGLSPFVLAISTVVLLTAVLILGYRRYREVLARESNQSRIKQQRIATLSAELKSKSSRKSEIAEMLPQITKKMTEILPPDAYPSIAVRSVKDFLHAGKVGYFVPAEGSSDYTLIVGVGFSQDWVGNVRIPPGEGILGIALQKKIVVSRMDPHASTSWRFSHRVLEELEIAPDFVAPVFGTSGIAGVLVVADCPFPLAEERVYVAMFADQLSTMLQHAALLASNDSGTFMDPLTGVANRLYFMQRFESEIRRTENYQQCLALFMFDIDNFKKINDAYGHHAGDVVIRRMAALVKFSTRKSDLVGRFGGNEFMVLLTSTTKEQAESFAEHMRKTISKTDIAIPGSEVPVRITISGGLAMFPIHGQSNTELFKAAEEALYESKRHGRNRILTTASIGLDSKIADEDNETPNSTGLSTDTGSDVNEYSLGELGGNLRL